MKFFHELKEKLDDPYYRNSHYLMINSILSAVLGFVFWIIVARNFDTYDVGLATALISVASMISVFSTFGLDNTIIRFLANEKDKEKFVNSAFTIIIILSTILSVAFLVGINFWAPKLNFILDSGIYIILFFIYNITNGLFLILNSTFISLRDTKYVLIQNILVNILRIPLPLFLVLLLGGFSIFASFTISMSITVIISLLFFTKNVLSNYKPKLRFDFNIYKDISRFSFVNYISTLFGNLPPLAIPLIILAYLPPQENAYYYMVFTIASVLFIIPSASTTSLLAEGSYDETKFFLNLKKTFKQTFIFVTPAVIFIILFGDKLLLIFGEGYSVNGSLLLSIFSLTTYLISLNLIYATYIRIKMRIKEILLLTPITSILILLISYTLIPKMGIIGIGIAYFLSMGIISIYIILALIKNEFEFKNLLKSFISR